MTRLWYLLAAKGTSRPEVRLSGAGTDPRRCIRSDSLFGAASKRAVTPRRGENAFYFIKINYLTLLSIWIANCSTGSGINLFARTGVCDMHSFAWWPTLIAVGVATFTDLRRRLIPNWLVLPFLLAGITASGWIDGWQGLGRSFEGLGLGLLIYGVLFWMGSMGAGDVKLAAAIGAWIGPGQLFFALFVTAIAGGIMVLVWATAAGFLPDLLKGAGNLVFGRKKGDAAPGEELVLSNPKTRKIPYAPAIALGTLISFFAR
jgi:prepilin peptidase CpaA